MSIEKIIIENCTTSNKSNKLGEGDGWLLAILIGSVLTLAIWIVVQIIKIPLKILGLYEEERPARYTDKFRK